MTLNFFVKMSKDARITYYSKRVVFLSFAKNFKLPVKTLPCVPISSKKVLFRDEYKIRTQKFQFHVSSPNNVPLLLITAMRVIAKFGTVISARRVRKWWSTLSPEEKQKVLAKVRSQKSIIALIAVCFVGAVTLYYYAHVVEDPITKRKRFIMLNKKQIYQVAEYEYENQRKINQNYIVPSYHPIHRRVTRVINNLLLSNRHIPELRDKAWSVTVVDRPDVTNAFALPNGKIFVFTGMLNVCTSDDQLAIVLAHEISHSILFHVAETMSKYLFVEFLLLIPSILFWSVFSDGWALFSDWIISELSMILIQLPFSRAIEKEADYVGLQLAAHSCYDVREAPVFWGKMKHVSTDMPVEWLSTHPRHETRQQELMELLPKALEIRDLSNCPPLRVKVSNS